MKCLLISASFLFLCLHCGSGFSTSCGLHGFSNLGSLTHPHSHHSAYPTTEVVMCKRAEPSFFTHEEFLTQPLPSLNQPHPVLTMHIEFCTGQEGLTSSCPSSLLASVNGPSSSSSSRPITNKKLSASVYKPSASLQTALMSFSLLCLITVASVMLGIVNVRHQLASDSHALLTDWSGVFPAQLLACRTELCLHLMKVL